MQKPAANPNTDIQILEHQVAYEGVFRIEKYKLRFRLFDGSCCGEIEREIFERGHAVAGLLFDPVLNKIVLIEQFRLGAYQQVENPWLLEIVAGIIDKDETPVDVLKRETQEEAGLTILDYIPIYQYLVSPGACTETVSLYCARVDASKAGGIYGLAHEHENIRVLVFDVNEVYELLATDKIKNAVAIIAIQWFQLNEKMVRAKWGNDKLPPS
jgi:ADP-ribose pyrophosphatase